MKRPRAGKAKFKAGQLVRVRKRGWPYARIRRFIADVPGGVVLDRLIDGFAYWNIEDLRPVSKERDQ